MCTVEVVAVAAVVAATAVERVWGATMVASPVAWVVDTGLED